MKIFYCGNRADYRMSGKTRQLVEAIRGKRRSFTLTGFVYVTRFPSAPFPPGTPQGVGAPSPRFAIRFAFRFCAEMHYF